MESKSDFLIDFALALKVDFVTAIKFNLFCLGMFLFAISLRNLLYRPRISFCKGECMKNSKTVGKIKNFNVRCRHY